MPERKGKESGGVGGLLRQGWHHVEQGAMGKCVESGWSVGPKKTRKAELEDWLATLTLMRSAPQNSV